jgi:hypothetical protein
MSIIEFNNFVEYIEYNNIEALEDFCNRDDESRAEYLYLHCSKRGISSFRFNDLDTEDAEKYAELVDLFMGFHKKINQP